MRSIYSIMMAGLGGVAAGAMLGPAVHAQSTDEPAYLVANIQQVRDQATMAQYRKQAAKIEATYGGQRIAAGMPEAIDGSELPRGQIIILRFPSDKALHDWWNSPAYSAVRPLRERASTGQLYVVPGAPAP